MSDSNKFVKVGCLVMAPFLGALIGFFLGFGDGQIDITRINGLDDIINGFSGIIIGGLAGLVIAVIFYLSSEHRKTQHYPPEANTNSNTTADPTPISSPDLSGRPPKSWLVESILATLFCCMPLGIVGIVYAAKVNGLYSNGDILGAQRASEQAKTWVLWSFGIGLFFGIISFSMGFFDLIF